MKNIAVLLAGGSGKRMGSILPKQFLKIGNKSIIQHTIEAFENHKSIDEICIIINAAYRNEINDLITNNNFSKIRYVLNGGKERKDSSLNAIKAYEKEQNVYLIFHDAVRPFVSERIITDVINKLKTGKSVAVAIPTTDTIFCLNQDKTSIKSVPERKLLRRAQTPQAFSYTTIKKAYDIATNDPDFVATDDCGVVLKYLPEETIYIVDGNESNIKITFEQDFLQGIQIISKK